jgi:hypothetical protein
MTASMRHNINSKLRDREIDGKIVVTLVANLQHDDEFDLRGVAMPPGYRLIVERVVPDEGTTELVRVFFQELPDGTVPSPARMNGTFPVSVIRG